MNVRTVQISESRNKNKTIESIFLRLKLNIRRDLPWTKRSSWAYKLVRIKHRRRELLPLPQCRPTDLRNTMEDKAST